MELTAAAITVLGAILIGAISPGPSFVIVARTAIAVSRADALAMSLGMGLGGLMFASAALVGLHVVLTNVPWLHLMLKIVGAGYLLYLAFRLWRGAGDPIAESGAPVQEPRGTFRSFLLGLFTQLSNPKTALWYASVFTAAVSAAPPHEFAVTVLPMVLLIETGWYAVVSVAFSLPAPRRGYFRSKRWIDRTAGSVMALLGLKLVWDSR